MDELRNLKQMASLASGRFNQYDGEDFVLPQVFKDQVKEINSNTITYNTYSAIIETKGSQHGILNIFLPNQWFYIASYFTDFYNELQKYKRYALQVTTKERLKVLNGKQLTGSELNSVANLDLDEASKERLTKFITDYSWWGGAKTIDRGDFYVSPILANANLVNASQSFVADLCAFLANKQELVQAIINKEENNHSAKHSRVLLFPPCIESKEGINGFLDRAIPIVLERDANLSKLSENFIVSSLKENILVGEFWLGRNKSKIDNIEELVRRGHINQNVAWDYNDSNYVLNREQTFETFEIFKDIFNDTYKGIFEIVIETKEHKGEQRKHYYLYSGGSASTAVLQSSFSSSVLIEKIKSTGLIYSDDLIKRFAYALMTKPFVILSGLAGSGKTQLALAFAECMSEDVERQVRVVSVGADWTNREPLLGYPNALKSDEYVMPECGALDLLIEANENPNKPYFLILDEMNLSVVERYFADFLSAMESKKLIALWKGESERVPHEIKLPKNLYIIGTINVDETTYMFSPKVLDRANVIEFKIAANEMETFLQNDPIVDRSACHSACAGMAEDFLTRTKNCATGADTDKIQVALNGFFKELKTVNAEFGYRTANEIYRYINNVGEELGNHGAIDTAILQKLLPKLHGSRKKLAPVLSALWKLCFKDADSVVAIEGVKDFSEVKGLIYKDSAEKILRMYNAVVDNGFTSFAEA